MQERGAARAIPLRAEDILTPKEVELLQAAERGERPCVTCGLPLRGEKLIIPEIH